MPRFVGMGGGDVEFPNSKKTTFYFTAVSQWKVIGQDFLTIKMASCIPYNL